MTRRRASAALVGAALIASIAPAGSAASHSAAPRRAVVVRHGVTQPVFSYAGAVRETVYVQSYVDQDGNGRPDLLATDIIRPAETDHGLRVPTIYEMSPYYQGLGRGNESEIKNEEDGDFVPDKFPLFYDNYFVPRGYAFIAQDMRGTRNSEGCMVLGGRYEILDAQATIDWLNGRNEAFTATGEPVIAGWSDGTAGMIGKSYDASVANGAASRGIKGLKTIVPISGISRWYDYHLNNGVQYPNAFVTPAEFAFDIDQTPGDDEERQQQWAEATFGENTFCSKVGAEIVAKAGDPRADYTRFWDRRDYLKNAGNVRASVFVVHGRNDFNVKPNHYWQWWQALSRRHVPRKIWLSETGHVDPFDYRRAEWVHTLHRWFDHWLYGVDNGIMKEPQADIERAPGVWRTYAHWPDRRTRPVRVYFGSRLGAAPGFLSSHKPRHASAQDFADDVNQSEDDMAADPDQAKPSRLVFLSPRLRRSVRIDGETPVVLRASLDRADTNFTALLVDYGEGDTIVREQYDGGGEGIATDQSKETCWGQSTEADDACYFVTREVGSEVPLEIVSPGWLDARHNETLRANNPIVPGRVYRFAWSIFAEDWVFERGHRIGIVLAASDPDQTIPDESSAGVHALLKRSRVLLPVVGGRARLGF